MPYKSKEDAREQKRNWRAKNRQKEKDYRKRHAGRKRIRAQERRDALWKRRAEVFGEVCILCGEKNFVGSPIIGYILHEIHGRPHYNSMSNSETRLKYALEHKEDFAPLCIVDHKMVHRLMKLFGVSWKEILCLLKKGRAETPMLSFS